MPTTTTTTTTGTHRSWVSFLLTDIPLPPWAMVAMFFALILAGTAVSTGVSVLSNPLWQVQYLPWFTHTHPLWILVGATTLYTALGFSLAITSVLRGTLKRHTRSYIAFLVSQIAIMLSFIPVQGFLGGFGSLAGDLHPVLNLAVALFVIPLVVGGFGYIWANRRKASVDRREKILELLAENAAIRHQLNEYRELVRVLETKADPTGRTGEN